MARIVRQLPLELDHPPALGRDDFLAGAGNRAALAFVERWPQWPGAAAALYGPPGSGKTHLASIWRARSDAVALTLAEIGRADPPQLLGAHLACTIDAGGWAGDAPLQETALLHLMNWLAQGGGHLLICARLPPARWPVQLPDLRSRLAAATALEIEAPDDALLAAVLRKLFADRQLAVPVEVVDYLVARMERSCETAGRLVAAIDRAALAARRGVTVPLAQIVLAALDGA